MKKLKIGKRPTLIDKFNPSIESGDFLRIFQEAMSEKLMLLECGEYDEKQFNRFLMSKMRRVPRSLNLKVRPLLLTCKVNPNFYLDIQETVKRMFGDYVAIDDLILFFLTHFVENYREKNLGKELPLFVRKYPGKSNSNLNRLHAKFSRFYKNHVVSFQHE